jgi:hypothetical protein
LWKINRGARAWYRHLDSPNQPIRIGPICYSVRDSEGNIRPGEITGQVLLRKDGTPVDDTLRVRSGLGAAAKARLCVASPIRLRTGLVVATDNKDEAGRTISCTLKIRRFPMKDFSGLGFFVNVA